MVSATSAKRRSAMYPGVGRKWRSIIMASVAFPKKIACLAAAASMLAMPVAASAQTTVAPISAAQVDPLIAFSLLGSVESRTALCGLSASHEATSTAVSVATAGVTTTDTTETTTQSAGGPGCVLPINDAVAAPPVTTAPGYPGIPPVLLLAAGGAIAWIIAILKDKGDGVIIHPPISPV